MTDPIAHALDLYLRAVALTIWPGVIFPERCLCRASPDGLGYSWAGALVIAPQLRG